jgi:hypothetical protein
VKAQKNEKRNVEERKGRKTEQKRKTADLETER